MRGTEQPNQLGLELFLQRPEADEANRIPITRGNEGEQLYPELDADGDHIHFEMVPMGGDSMLWLTIRRGTPPDLVVDALRKIADIVERHGDRLLTLLRGGQGSFSANGEMISGPLRLAYDDHGDLIIPE
jgi:hypothetical protein